MPRRYIYADEDKDDDELIWDALGRGSAAGRHLYNLYNGNTDGKRFGNMQSALSLIHISEPTRPERISYAVFCLKKKNSDPRNRWI